MFLIDTNLFWKFKYNYMFRLSKLVFIRINMEKTKSVRNVINGLRLQNYKGDII